jgi:lipopolysaccharide transport system ATP-binding protein
MSAEIQIDDATVRFRIYRNPSPALKEMAINLFTRRSSGEVLEYYALKNLSLTIHGGERVGIIGLNGAGKTTLLKMIVGIYPAFRGHVHVGGRVTPLIEVGTGFDLEMSGRQNIYLNGTLLAHSRQEMMEREKQIIEFSGLGEHIDTPIKYYSSGMLGRLAFSIATMIEPEILLVDEIFSTGDALFVDKAAERMLSLFDRSQIVVLVSHNMNHIEEFCNRVIVLHHGEIVNDGPPAEMIDFYHTHIAGRGSNASTEDRSPMNTDFSVASPSTAVSVQEQSRFSMTSSLSE